MELCIYDLEVQQPSLQPIPHLPLSPSPPQPPTFPSPKNNINQKTCYPHIIKIPQPMKYHFQESESLLQSSRTGFVQKVYTILSVQLLTTTFFVLLNIYSSTFAKIQATYTVLSWVMIAVAMVSLLVLMSSANLCKTYPTNLGILAAFTVAESYLVSSICAMYEPESVLLAAVATAAATFGITFYAMVTKDDFTKWMTSFYAFASGIFWVFLFLSLFNIFVVRSPFISTAMAFVVACIYCVYILVDTQLILGGKNKELTLDNHILGAVILYVDIIGLFLKILQILGDKKNDKEKR